MSTTQTDEAWLSLVEGLSPEQLEAWALTLPPDELAHVERVLGERMAIGWRATPATMAHFLTRGEYQLWPYIELMGRETAAAFAGVMHADYPRVPARQVEGCWPNLMIMIASQYGKTASLMNTIIWALDRNPRLRLIYISYDANKAVEEAGKARDFAERHSADLRFRLRSDKRARGMWATDEGGGLYAVGINGGITGWPADGMLTDDLFKGWETAHSETQRDAVWNIYRSQVRFRLQGFWCPKINSGTRWHEDDVAARLRKTQDTNPEADRWRILRLPTVAEVAQPDAVDPLLREADPLGREPGQLLEPRRFPEEEVAARRATAGAYLFASLEQQRPAPEEGTEIKRDWWKISEDMPLIFDEVITSSDMKLKDKESGDFFVIQTWGRTGSDFWLIAQLRGQWNQPTCENAIALAAVRQPDCRLHVIESTGNGPEVIAALRMAHEGYDVSDEIAGLIGMTESERAAVSDLRRRGMTAIAGESVKGDKRARLRTHSGLIEAGNVHLWARSPWLAGYLEELSAFPNGAHDDQVDATSQALKRLRGGDARIGSVDALTSTRI